MNQIILNVLCEGPTEDRFVQKVLKPYLKDFGIVVKTQLLLTNKKKNIRGGMISYERAKNDLLLWIKQHSTKTYETHYFTTMFDLYALPDDFPGFAAANKKTNCYDTVHLLEAEFGKDVTSDCFIPYIQLHEFEALVFCGLEYLLVDYPDMTKEVESLREVLTRYDQNPEKINNSPSTAPSRRIIKAFESKHHYDKPKQGEFVTDKVGIAGLKDRCSHFKEWIEKLEKIIESVE
nr:DUF4276 family protein [uncultured Bacteroides sp.]